jgi:hypothetical protein
MELHAEGLFEKLLLKFPDIINQIPNIDDFKSYLVFILEKEISNAKYLSSYNANKENKEQIIAELEEKHNEIYKVLYEENVDNWNIMLNPLIIKFFRHSAEQELAQQKLNKEKRDQIAAQLTAIRQLINQIRDGRFQEIFLKRYYTGIEPSAILDSDLDTTINNLNNDIESLRYLITMVFYREFLDRNGLEMLFSNLLRHSRDIDRVRWMTGIIIDPSVVDGEIAEYIHNLFKEIMKEYERR